MSPRKFLIIACLVALIVLVAANWTQVKAALPKLNLPGGAAGGTDTSGGAPAKSNTGGTKSTGGGGAAILDYNKQLGYNPKAALPEVRELQALLNRVNAVKKRFAKQLVEDGKFGTNTLNMLRQYGGVTAISLTQAYQKVQAAYGM